VAEPGRAVNRFKHTVPCERAAEEAATDEFGNATGEDRTAVEFTAAFIPPTSATGSQITDGTLRETTVTKPTLMVEPIETNSGAFVPDAIRSGDALTVDGDAGWEVDGDPALWVNTQSGKTHLLAIELRRTVG
jgi:hypothetical protein